jgi:hypothetical protein
MDMDKEGLTCGAVCVYPSRVAECVALLKQYGAEQVNTQNLSQHSSRMCGIAQTMWVRADDTVYCVYPSRVAE